MEQKFLNKKGNDNTHEQPTSSQSDSSRRFDPLRDTVERKHDQSPERSPSPDPLEQSIISSQPERTMLANFNKRYITEVDGNEDHSIVKTRVKGSEAVSYESDISLNEGTITIHEAYRKRPEHDKAYGSDFVYDNEANPALGSEPMRLRDIVRGQIVKTIKEHSSERGITKLKDFPLSEFAAEDIQDPHTVKTADRFVKPGETKYFEEGSDGYKEMQKTVFGRVSGDLIQLGFSDRKVEGVEVDRSSYDKDTIDVVSFRIDKI